METILESIRAAVADEATPEARAAGIAACRAVLATLEATPGQPMAAALPIDPNAIASVVGALRGVPIDQLLDMAIAKLRAALPAGTEVAPVARLNFNLIPVPRKG